MSLPRLLGTTLTTIPASVAYLSADQPLYLSGGIVSPHRTRIPRRHRFQQATQRYAADRFVQNFTWIQFEPLARIPNVQLFSLRVGPAPDQIAALKDALSSNRTGW